MPTLRFLTCDKLNPLDVTVWNSFAKLVFKPTADHTFKLTGEYYDSDSTVNQLYNYNVVSSGIRNGPNIRNQVKSRKRVAFEHEWQAGLSFLDSVRWQASFSPQERTFVTNNLQTLANGQQRLTRGLHDYSEQFSQLDIQAKSSFALGPSFHRLTYGFQGDITKTNYERRDDVRNLTTGVTTTTIAGGFNFANSTTNRYDFYIQDEIELLSGRWTITPGLRYANYNIDPKPGRATRSSRARSRASSPRTGWSRRSARSSSWTRPIRSMAAMPRASRCRRRSSFTPRCRRRPST